MSDPIEADTRDDDSSDSFGEAVDEFRESLSATLGSPETERRIVELFEQYSAVVVDAIQQTHVRRAAAERYEPYAAAVGAAYSSADARAGLDRAFGEYVDALQEAWTNVDRATIGPADLSSIADEMNWVATIVHVVHSTSGPGG